MLRDKTFGRESKAESHQASVPHDAAVSWRCSVKRVFFEISQSSQEMPGPLF